jgi:AcrR family transcriptional regulator
MGLRERKKQATRDAIHHGAMRLFAEHGYAGTTIDQIAAEADVSRATVFTYYATKEDIVFGEAPQAIARLGAALQAAPSTIAVVRGWLRGLSGWIDPDLLLQRRLAREVPAVGAARLRIFGDIQAHLAAALERELGDPLAARLGAASLIAALGVVEDTAAQRMEAGGAVPDEAEIDAVLDAAIAYTEAGLGALRRSGLVAGGRLDRADGGRVPVRVVLDDGDLDRGGDGDREQRA